MPCHVLITSTLDNWGPGWPALDVPPLTEDDAVDLVRAIAGDEVADRLGLRLARLAGGLPVQIVPASATLAYEARRGRLDDADPTLTREAGESFRGVYERLDESARLLLHAAARFNPQQNPARRARSRADRSARLERRRVPPRLRRLPRPLPAAGGAEGLRMHQLFASFLRGQPPGDEVAGPLVAVLAVQARRLVEAAREVRDHPADADPRRTAAGLSGGGRCMGGARRRGW